MDSFSSATAAAAGDVLFPSSLASSSSSYSSSTSFLSSSSSSSFSSYSYSTPHPAASAYSTDPDSLSLSTVLFFQQFPILDWPMLFLSTLADPHSIFLYVFPLLYFLYPPSLSLRLLFSLFSSDLLNGVLKLPIRGDRPYWRSKRVREFLLTCESGWGFPSGHCMIGVGVGVTLIEAVAYGSAAARRRVRVGFGGVAVLIAVSRMHVGSHYLGQVVMGVICGYGFAYVVQRYQVMEKIWSAVIRFCASSTPSFTTSTSSLMLSDLFASLVVSLSLLLIPLIELGLLSLLSIDPLASIALARSGCDATAHLSALTREQTQFQVERSPLMGCVRDAGVAAGALFAVLQVWRRYQKYGQQSSLIVERGAIYVRNVSADELDNEVEMMKQHIDAPDTDVDTHTDTHNTDTRPFNTRSSKFNNSSSSSLQLNSASPTSLSSRFLCNPSPTSFSPTSPPSSFSLSSHPFLIALDWYCRTTTTVTTNGLIVLPAVRSVCSSRNLSRGFVGMLLLYVLRLCLSVVVTSDLVSLLVDLCPSFGLYVVNYLKFAVNSWAVIALIPLLLKQISL